MPGSRFFKSAFIYEDLQQIEDPAAVSGAEESQFVTKVERFGSEATKLNV